MKTQRNATVRIDYRTGNLWEQFGFFNTSFKVDAESCKAAIAWLSAQGIPFRVISGR